MAAADLHLVSLVPGLEGCVVPSKTYGILAMGKPIVAAVDEGSEVDLVLRVARCGVRVEPERRGGAGGGDRIWRRTPTSKRWAGGAGSCSWPNTPGPAARPATWTGWPSLDRVEPPGRPRL